MTSTSFDAQATVKEDEQTGHFALVTKADKITALRIDDVFTVTRLVYRLLDSPIQIANEPLVVADVIFNTLITDGPIAEANFNASRRMSEGPGLYRVAYEFIVFDDQVDDGLGPQKKWAIFEIFVESIP